MRKTYSNYILKHTPLFKEKYLIFEIGEDLEEKLGEAGVALANVATKLLETVNTIAEKGISALDYSGAYLKKGVNWAEAKIKGEPIDLQEYQFLFTHFPDENTVISNYPGLSNNSDVRDIIRLHTRIAFLNLRIAQVKKFIEPALRQFQLVEQRYNQIKKLRKSRKRFRAQELDEEIKRLSRSIENSRYEKGPSVDTKRLLLKEKKSEFEVLKKELAIQTIEDIDKDPAVIEWSLVFLNTTKFPPSYGSDTDRVVVRDSDKKTTDLNELYKYLESYLEPYKEDLEKYSDEMDKLKYYRDNLIAVATKDLESKDSNKYEKAEKLKENLGEALDSIDTKLETEKSTTNSPNYYPYSSTSKNIYGINPTSFKGWQQKDNISDDEF